MAKIQIKRYNGSTTSWENQFPITKAQHLVATSDGTTTIFDENDKIKPTYLPNSVFDSLYFYDVISGNTTLGALAEDVFESFNSSSSRSRIGVYFVANTSRTITPTLSATLIDSEYWIGTFKPSEEGDDANENAMVLETGDWIVLTAISGAGTIGSPWNTQWAVVNNTYELAGTSVDGIVRLSSQGTYANLAGNNVITDARLKALIDSQNFTNTSHTHLLAAGATDVTATASELNLLDGELITTTELNYLSGVTSAIQTQINGKANTSHTHTLSAITDVTATATELNYSSGVTSAIQTQLNAKAPTANPTFTGTVVLPSTTSIGTISATELSYVDGVTSAIQTQLNAKANLAGGATFTGTIVLPSTTSIGNIDSTELGYLDGVTSAIQTQLNAKQATITGAASTIVTNDLAPSRAAISNGAGKIAASDVTSTELGYLDGVTSAIQPQLNTLSSRVRVYYDGTPSGMVTNDIWFDAV